MQMIIIFVKNNILSKWGSPNERQHDISGEITREADRKERKRNREKAIVSARVRK